MSSPDPSGDADALDDELDIELRPAAEVAARAIVLAAVLQRLALERAATPVDEADEAFDLREWLREQRLLDHVTLDERDLLERPTGSLTPGEVSTWTWQGEALAALAWALHLTELDLSSVRSDLGPTLALIPSPWDATGGWRQQARQRPEPAIVAEREHAELWHWRAIAEATRREASRDESTEIEIAIADVVAEVSATRLIASIRNGDFAVKDLPVHDLAPDDLDDLQAATAERLRALNWLCGFGDSWQNTPLDV